jgi:ABC-type uncharacterized transport system substrate-binding protein
VLDVRRRDFIMLLGGAAAAWPLAGRAQQAAMPVIGYLSGRSPNDAGYLLAAFQQGLTELGFVEGQNVTFEYRWANNRYDQLPGMATDLAFRRVAVIAAVNGIAAPVAAMTATQTVPIVFALGVDPIKQGLVASLNKPGGNVTGVSFLNNTLTPKMIELLNEVVPKSGVFGILVNPKSPNTDFITRDAHAAADALGRKLVVVGASTESDFNLVFKNLQQQAITALLIASDSFLDNRVQQIAELAARHAVIVVSPRREFAEAGGLMSYGTNVPDAFRLAGVYAARIIKGAKPVDLPVQQSTKVELILNLKTAKALGLTVPLPLLGRADEVIE